ncbi:MAG: electron transfer flavoprotein subunit alpha/FixB family protein [Bacillota bacterium]
MGYIKINQDKINQEVVEQLKKICPFDAFDYQDAYLSINAACKLCKLCVNKGPKGICEFIEEDKVTIDKSEFKGITVYIEQRENKAHPVAWELIGKAKELTKTTKEPLYAIVIGKAVEDLAKQALEYGVDKVFIYQDKSFNDFNVEIYTNILVDFQRRIKPNIILFGGTSEGRSFAPRVAARLKTGLTADCTKLGIKENGDLIQIRPAFGGNIMAKIHTPNNRPQLATARYKIFDAPQKVKPFGKIIKMDTLDISKDTNIKLLKSENKPKVKDISDAEIIIAIGRAFKKKKDLDLIKPLVEKLNAEVACTRPLIENGWFDPRKQIGLSGRTVKPKLIINLGISGAIQYIEGMKDSELIITVNNDLSNKLFSISHYSIVGDIYEVIPELNKLFKVN